jgi:hypothetical protein
LPSSKRLELAKFLSKDQVTPSGFWIQRPKGVGKGKLIYRLRGNSLEVSIPGKMRDVVLSLNARLILRNPEKALTEAMQGRKRPRQVRLMVNGFQGNNSYSAKQFFEYMHDDLLPFLRKRRGLTVDQINTIFQLRMIY